MKTKSVKKPKPVFVEGPIDPTSIGVSIANHQSKTDIGAHNIFLGQVRKDEINGKEVKAIEFTAYTEMAEKKINEIRETAFERFDLSCMHIYHSLGIVQAGEICFFVFVSSPHRDASYEASTFIVEEIKAKVPIYGKELFEDDTHQWKVNK